MKWTNEQIKFLVENYPKYGKAWCCEKMQLSERQIRYKASKLQLKAMGISIAWQEKQKQHAQKLLGRIRSEHSAFMKQKYKDNLSPLIAWVKNNGQIISENRKQWYQNNPHPKGALGMKHSPETKKILSERSKQMWANMTDEQLDGYSKRAAINGNKQTMNRAKASWKASWREIGGYKKYYRSRWEANYARYLEWMRMQGLILGWLHEPETFWFEGIKRGCMSYLPDFKVKEIDGKESYHEVKGWMDDRSKTKIKRMAKYHPNVKLVVVDTKEYKLLEKKMKPIITDWE
jgi:hypothetical protein